MAAGKRVARPRFQPHESLVGVVGLAGLVVLAAHDQHVVTFVQALDTQVVIRIRGVPQQDLRHGAARHAGTDHEGPIRRLLGVNCHQIVDRCIGGHHDGLGRDGATRRLHIGLPAALNFRGLRAAVETCARLLRSGRHALQVVENVKLRLTWKSQGRAGIEGRDRRPCHARYVGETRSVRRLQLPVQLPRVVAGRHEQIAVQARKVAVDVPVARDALDGVDRRGMAFRRQPGAVGAVQPFEVVKTIVEGAHEVRGRPARLASGNRAVVEHDDLLSFLGEQISSGQAGDPGAYDADVGDRVSGKRCRIGHRRRGHPDGSRASVVSHRSTLAIKLVRQRLHLFDLAMPEPSALGTKHRLPERVAKALQ